MKSARGAPDATPPASQEPSDETLVSQVAGGDADALRILYRRLSPVAYALALRVTGDEADGEEVLVDAFHQVWKQAAQYDPSRGTVIGWLLNITRSRAIDRIRARRRVAKGKQRVAEAGSSFPAQVPANPEQEAIRHDEKERLMRVIAELPADQRWAIELAYFSGLSQSQIAERLGQPLGTVKTRIRLAMEKMRRAVIGQGFAPG
jgi:RNA polymerase sigma-70 factor (ECF subfamily)